jgi:hypothetical protein
VLLLITTEPLILQATLTGLLSCGVLPHDSAPAAIGMITVLAMAIIFVNGIT